MSTGNANTNVSNQGPSIVTRTMFPGDYAACDEGSFYTANLQVTASTAVATTTQALGATNPTFALFNGQPAGGYNLYLRYIKIFMTAVTTGATTAQAVGTLDNTLVKLTTVGTAMTITNTNSASGTNSKAAAWAGVNIAAANSPSGRVVHSAVLTNSIPIVLDVWVMAFGEPAYTDNLIGTMSLVKKVSVSCPPIIIAPQWWYTLGIWGASWAASAQTYSIECGFIERPAGQ